MAFEMKDGQLTLFKNKKTKETQPDLNGKIKINGVEMKISLWKKTSKSGDEYFSGIFEDFKPKEKDVF